MQWNTHFIWSFSEMVHWSNSKICWITFLIKLVPIDILTKMPSYFILFLLIWLFFCLFQYHLLPQLFDGYNKYMVSHSEKNKEICFFILKHLFYLSSLFWEGGNAVFFSYLQNQVSLFEKQWSLLSVFWKEIFLTSALSLIMHMWLALIS